MKFTTPIEQRGSSSLEHRARWNLTERASLLDTYQERRRPGKPVGTRWRTRAMGFYEVVRDRARTINVRIRIKVGTDFAVDFRDWSVHAHGIVFTYLPRGGERRGTILDNVGVRARTYGEPFHARFSTYRVTILPTVSLLTTITTTVNAHYNGFMLLIRTHWAGFE